MRRLALRCVVGCAVVSAAATIVGGAGAAVQNFTVVADTYSSAENQTSTHGTLTYMKVEGIATTGRTSYVRFVVSGTSGAVTRATLRVFSLTSSTSGFDVRFVADNSWDENTLTNGNAPPPSASVTATSGPFAAGIWLSLDVSSLVGGDGTYSFAFTTTGSQIQLATKERGASLAAQLEVEWSGVVTAPANTSPPVVSGTAEEGRTLTATTGSWSGTTPLTYAYQWRRCDSAGANCADITGAAASSYTLTAADVGFTVRAAVTASNSAGSATAVSAPTAVVAAAVPPANATRPTISGTAEQGRTLTADPGTWSGSTPISFAYQWRRCSGACTDIAFATAQTYTLQTDDVGWAIRVAVIASNVAGSATAESDSTAVVTSPVSVTVLAAGDVACDPASSSFNGGLGTSTSCRQKYTSDLLLDPAAAAILALGDLQYECGGGIAFAQSYDPSWGRVKSITRPAPGNKEYATSGGTNCDKTGKATGYYNYFGAAAGDRAKGYYSYDLGSWHLIALNSNCSSVGGCGAGSPQETWLKSDLAASSAACTLAYWHHPRFSSSTGDTSTVSAFWNDLYAANADVVLNGHSHVYERFAPQTPAGTADNARGIREFIVGTGGRSFHSFSTTEKTSQVRNNTTFGVLKLTLRPTGYDWQFVPEAGKTFTDSGSTACH